MKSAITVIDQELIDRVGTCFIGHKGLSERAEISVGTLLELYDMTKDLIEINAELTKREQKYKGKYKGSLHTISETGPTPVIVNYVNEALKGGSDE